MASTSMTAATTKSILQPVTTLKGHGNHIRSISYFPDGQRMISGSEDKTARQWDLKAGKEIEEARGVWKKELWAVEVSRDGRWVVTAGGDDNAGELKGCEVETGVAKTFEGHSGMIICIDISADSKILASGAIDSTARIWNLETGQLVAGPFKSVDWVGAVRFSTDSKKLAVKSHAGMCLEVWDVETQKLDVRKGIPRVISGSMFAPVIWTNKNKNILTSAFTFTDIHPSTIYEFDASTLETVGAHFEGHTNLVTGLALSSDSTLLASGSCDDTIKLWAFESRKLLASFKVRDPLTLVLSPDSRQLAYTRIDLLQVDHKIYICNTPHDILAQTSANKNSSLTDVLQSDATRRPPAVRLKPLIYVTPMSQRPPTIDPQPSISLRLRRLFWFPHRTNANPPIRNDQLRGPLDFPATSPLPHPLSGRTTTQGRLDVNSGENSRSLPITQSSTTSNARPHNLSGRTQPPIVDVPLAQGKERNAAADAPKKDDDIVPDEFFDPPSPNPDSQQPTAAQTNTGEHGGDRCCFCF